MDNRYDQYIEAIRKPFFKLCKLRFLNPDGTVAFALDSNPNRLQNKTFIQSGSLSVNLQNGSRRSVDVTIANITKEFQYELGNLWFGTEIALDEGVILDDGDEYYIQQGVFLIQDPEETLNHIGSTLKLNLVDKWANLDGTLFGNLEGTHEVPVNTNIFEPIRDLLIEDKGNGYPIDNVTPIFTDYYNDKTQVLPDGTTASLVKSPYTLTVDSGTVADVILGMNTMVNGMIGYDESGALRLDPSQDDILDITKPVVWTFSMQDVELLNLAYTSQNTKVYNDYIIIGETLDDNSQPKGRAQNYDPKSPTNINLIGRKTFREQNNSFYTDTQCQDMAEWKLKRATVLQKAVNVSCSQILHIKENSLIEIVRTDKEGSPVERHLVQGFSRPLATTGNMTISAISVADWNNITIS